MALSFLRLGALKKMIIFGILWQTGPYKKKKKDRSCGALVLNIFCLIILTFQKNYYLRTGKKLILGTFESASSFSNKAERGDF